MASVTLHLTNRRFAMRHVPLAVSLSPTLNRSISPVGSPLKPKSALDMHEVMTPRAQQKQIARHVLTAFGAELEVVSMPALQWINRVYPHRVMTRPTAVVVPAIHLFADRSPVRLFRR